MIRFLHTADLQIGKPFANVPGDAGARLREVRIEALERVVGVARERHADLLLVAGDFFDSNTVDERAIARACAVIGRAGLPVYAIPGNHDHGGADSVYRAPRFLRHRPENLHVLLDREPVVVAEGRAVLLPAPLLRRHEVGDTTAHITRDLGRDLAPGAVRIALAHGGIHGFQDEGEAHNEVDPGLPGRAEVDYLALGDWHGCRQVGPRAWYSGTPEPDRFKDNDPGHVLLVTVAAPGAPPEVERIPTGRFRWLRHAASLSGPEDVEALAAWLDALDRPHETLVRLELSGVLPFEAAHRLEEVIGMARARLHHLRERGEVHARPDEAELRAMVGEGFVGAAVEALRERAERGDGIALRALELLYRMRVEEVVAC